MKTLLILTMLAGFAGAERIDLREQQAEPEPSNEPPPVDWHAADEDVPF